MERDDHNTRGKAASGGLTERTRGSDLAEFLLQVLGNSPGKVTAASSLAAFEIAD